jgi:hypothetical protein
MNEVLKRGGWKVLTNVSRSAKGKQNERNVGRREGDILTHGSGEVIRRGKNM